MSTLLESQLTDEQRADAEENDRRAGIRCRAQADALRPTVEALIDSAMLLDQVRRALMSGIRAVDTLERWIEVGESAETVLSEPGGPLDELREFARNARGLL